MARHFVVAAAILNKFVWPIPPRTGWPLAIIRIGGEVRPPEHHVMQKAVPITRLIFVDLNDTVRKHDIEGAGNVAVPE